MKSFHVNAKGEPGACRAHRGQCPFGEHFSSAEQAAQNFENSMQLQLFATQTKTPAAVWEDRKTQLKQALTTQQGVMEAKQAWEKASIEYASTEEGLQTFSQLEAKAEAGSTAHALYRHFLSEGNRLRLQRTSPDELMTMLDENAPAKVPALLPKAASPVPWASFDPEAITYATMTKVKDVVEHQRAIDEFYASPATASPEQLRKAAVGAYHYGKMRWSMPPKASDTRKYVVSEAEWKPMSKAGVAYGARVAEDLMAQKNFPEASVETLVGGFDEDVILKMSSCPLSFKEDYASTMQSWPEDEEVQKTLRENRHGSNRIALYLAAHDQDSFERAEAFNQVIVAGMETLEEKDRLWLAHNLDRMPTSPETLNTIKQSLALWAKGHADADERTELLSIVEPAPEPKKRFWRG